MLVQQLPRLFQAVNSESTCNNFISVHRPDSLAIATVVERSTARIVAADYQLALFNPPYQWLQQFFGIVHNSAFHDPIDAMHICDHRKRIAVERYEVG
jgi:hypothetical protein